jgi:MFS family permease
MITAALALLTQVPPDASYVSRLLPLLALFGLGAGLTLPAVTSLGMSGATDADSGALSGVFNTAQQVGGALGLAVLTTLAASRTGTAQTPQALTSGYHLAWAVGAILAGASVVVAAIALRQPDAPDRLLDVDGPVAHRPARDVPRLGGARGIPDSVECER